MNPYRIASLLVVSCCLLSFKPLSAQDTTSPFGGNKQFSADMNVTTAKGQNITQKVYTDSGKVRMEINMQGMQAVTIVRPDQNKVYTVLVGEKMVMEAPYNAEKYKKLMVATSGPDGTVEVVGPDTVDGVACTKYKITSKDGKVSFFWNDASTKAPVKLAADDGSYTILWTNYKAGPQDPSLFEPPAGYQTIPMPSGMPGQ